MEHLFPYRQTKNKAFFKDGKKELVVTRKSKYHLEGDGDEIDKILDWPVNFTPNLSMMKLTWKNTKASLNLKNKIQ